MDGYVKENPRAGVVAHKHCPTCEFRMVDGVCFWCDHGCSACGQPISLKYEAFCEMCGICTFRCPGEGCRSKIHQEAPALADSNGGKRR